MSPNPFAFIEHLRKLGYHPRSDKHSNALAECIVVDLMKHCRSISSKAERGETVYDLNFTLFGGTAEWNVDLVIGAPPLNGAPAPMESHMTRMTPSTIEIAIELKSVMTEHRKAVKNRKRDMEAHHEHVHRYNDSSIAAGVFVVNASEKFKSPLRNTVTTHKDPAKLVAHCIDEMRFVTSRNSPGEMGLDAKCVIVVKADNIENASTEFVTRSPAPPVGDPMHYDAFIQRICSLYTARFS